MALKSKRQALVDRAFEAIWFDRHAEAAAIVGEQAAWADDTLSQHHGDALPDRDALDGVTLLELALREGAIGVLDGLARGGLSIARHRFRMPAWEVPADIGVVKYLLEHGARAASLQWVLDQPGIDVNAQLHGERATLLQAILHRLSQERLGAERLIDMARVVIAHPATRMDMPFEAPLELLACASARMWAWHAAEYADLVGRLVARGADIDRSMMQTHPPVVLAMLFESPIACAAFVEQGARIDRAHLGLDFIERVHARLGADGKTQVMAALMRRAASAACAGIALAAAAHADAGSPAPSFGAARSAVV